MIGHLKIKDMRIVAWVATKSNSWSSASTTRVGVKVQMPQITFTLVTIVRTLVPDEVALYYMQVVCKTLIKTWKARSWPLYVTLALLPPPLFFFFFFFFCFLKNLLRLKINILSSIYPEINFPAEPVMKINILSRPKVPAPPPSESNGRPLRNGNISEIGPNENKSFYVQYITVYIIYLNFMLISSLSYLVNHYHICT